MQVGDRDHRGTVFEVFDLVPTMDGDTRQEITNDVAAHRDLFFPSEVDAEMSDLTP